MLKNASGEPMMLKDTTIQDAPTIAWQPGPAPKPVDLGSITKLHKLLDLALDDFETAVGDRNYIIHMGQWYSPATLGRCYVCLAGAVMAISLEMEPSIRMSPSNSGCSWRTANALRALNSLRQGYVVKALEQISRRKRGQKLNVPKVALALEEKWIERLCAPSLRCVYGHYEGRKLLTQLRLMQADLEAAGL
jgi:hypothetical protein